MSRMVYLGQCESCEGEINITEAALYYRVKHNITVELCKTCLYSKTQKEQWAGQKKWLRELQSELFKKAWAAEKQKKK